MPTRPVRGTTSVSQMAVSTASTWQKKGRMPLNRCRQCWSRRAAAVVFVELAQGDPQELGGFFWISSIASARCKRRFRRAFSRSSREV